MTRVPRIAIIGGGLSGLATATHLKLLAKDQSLDLDIQLFESADRLGGVIHSESVSVENVGDFVVDHGADMFATAPPAAIELCRALDADQGLLRPKVDGRGAMIARGNRLIPIPEGFVLMRPTKFLSMLTTPLLTPLGKLRLFSERFIASRDSSVKDESVGSFVRRRLGTECLDRIVAPLVAGIYTADVDRLSMAATMKPIWEMEAKDGSLAKATLRRLRSGEDSTERSSSGARYEQFRAFPEGMIGLIDLLANSIGDENIRLRSPIDSVKRKAGRFKLSVGELPAGDTGEFDHVVLTTPAPVTSRLLGSLSQDLDEDESEAIEQVTSALRQIRYASTAIVVMGVHRRYIARMPKTFGFVVPPGEDSGILAGSFASEKFSGRAPDDYVIIRCFVGGVMQPELLKLSDDELVRMVVEELGKLIGLSQTMPLAELAAFHRVIRWNEAMPQYEVGHADKANAIRESMQLIDGIHLMTNSLMGVGIAPVIGQAKNTAESIISAIGLRTRDQ